MKKSSFVITETILALVLTATVAGGAVIALDINKNNIVPEKMTDLASFYGNDNKEENSKKENSEKDNSEKESSVEENSKQENSKQETSIQENSKQETSKQEESKQEVSEVNAVVPPQLKEPEKLSTQPKELTQFLKNYNYNYDYMLFDHLIVVDTKSTKATIYCYQKSEKGYWWNIMGDGKALTDKGFIGEGGIDFVVENGSKITPMGFYELGDGFYINDKPNTTYPMFQITDNTYWVDDNKSKYYNTKVEGTDKKDWSSADHMITSPDAYKYGLVVEYNTNPVEKKVGSSIFLCCGKSATEGSVVVPEECMKAILEWLDKDSDAFIFII